MPTTDVNGIELYFETFGSRTDPTVLMVCGLGAQCIGYDVELCEQIAAGGYQVVRFDNRDSGLSTHLDDRLVDPLVAFAALGAGQPVDAPYTLADMAADAVGLLDALDLESVHVFGASMGGMIAQMLAIGHPDRVLSLTSVMSTTGEPDVGQPAAETLLALAPVMSPAQTREQRIDQSVALARTIGTPHVFDESRARARAAASTDRAYDPAGTGRQLVGILASGSRADGLAGLGVPTAVLHGDRDPLVHVSGGRRTAELVPAASYHELELMGHDLPPEYWDRIVAGLIDNASRSAH